MRRKISIIGISGVFRDAKDICEFWSQSIHKENIQIEQNNLKPFGAGESPEKTFAYKAAEQALLSANMIGENAIEFNHDRVGVILAVHPKEAELSETLAKKFDLRGTCYSIDVAGAGSFAAIKYAINELECGNCDVVLTGGLNLISQEMSENESNLEADGMGMLLLKCYEETDKPYGYIRISAALEDGAMLEEIKDNYIKSMLQWILSLHHKVIPSKPEDAQQTTSYQPWITNEKRPLRLAALSFYHQYLIMEEYRNDNRFFYRLHNMPTMVVLSGSTKAELMETSEHLLTDLQQNPHAYTETKYNSNPIHEEDIRLGFVALDSQDAVKKIQRSLVLLTEHEEEENWELEGIQYRSRGIRKDNKVATVFVGNNQVSPFMCRELGIHYPVYREAITSADNTMLSHGKKPISDYLYPIDNKKNSIQESDKAYILEGVSTGIYAILKRRGFYTDYFIEHDINRATRLRKEQTIMETDLNQCLEKAYQDGTRVFVIIGNDSTFEQQIHNTLKGKEIKTISIQNITKLDSFLEVEHACMKLKVLGVSIEKDPYHYVLDQRLEKLHIKNKLCEKSHS